MHREYGRRSLTVVVLPCGCTEAQHYVWTARHQDPSPPFRILAAELGVSRQRAQFLYLQAERHHGEDRRTRWLEQWCMDSTGELTD